MEFIIQLKLNSLIPIKGKKYNSVKAELVGLSKDDIIFDIAAASFTLAKELKEKIIGSGFNLKEKYIFYYYFNNKLKRDYRYPESKIANFQFIPDTTFLLIEFITKSIYQCLPSLAAKATKYPPEILLLLRKMNLAHLSSYQIETILQEISTRRKQLNQHMGITIPQSLSNRNVSISENIRNEHVGDLEYYTKLFPVTHIPQKQASIVIRK